MCPRLLVGNQSRARRTDVHPDSVVSANIYIRLSLASEADGCPKLPACQIGDAGAANQGNHGFLSNILEARK